MATELRSSEYAPQKRKFTSFQEHDGFPQESITVPSASDPTIPVPDDGNNLCPQCAAFNFAKAFKRKVRDTLGDFVMDLPGSISDLEESSCSLCRLFASVAPRNEEPENADEREAGNKSLHVRAFSATKVFVDTDPSRFAAPDTTVLGLVDISNTNIRRWRNGAGARIAASLRKSGCLCLVSPKISQGRKGVANKIGVRLMRADSFDRVFARYCLAYCDKHHGEICKQIVGSQLSPYFKVIDCKTRTIVKAPPNCKYAALSYVWGTSEAGTVDQSIDNAQGTLSTDVCPVVIRDSLVATLSLDLQYLWIDRYCIDQADVKEKHDQISQMDVIYAMAYVTIVAATRNPNDGLPGTAGSNSIRKLQPQVNICGQIIASTLPNPQISVEESRWVTRGWTYQEGILSKRRLIFTENQVAFDCGGMHYPESLILPLDAMHYKREKERGFRKHIPDGALKLKSPGKDNFDIMSYIYEFSKRELSFPGDRINAMKGIFHAFETAPQPVYQIMGIPILQPYTSNWPENAVEGFQLGLTWSHIAPGTRAAAFPSWSWAGWSGKLNPGLLFSPGQKSTSFANTDLEIEREDGELIPFHSAWGDLRDHKLQPRFIHLRAWTFPCSIGRGTDKELPALGMLQKNVAGNPKFAWGQINPEDWYVEFEAFFLFKETAFWKIRLDKPLKKCSSTRSRFSGVIIGTEEGWDGENQSIAIIVEEFEEYVERVAITAGELGGALITDENREFSLERHIFSISPDRIAGAKRRHIILG